MCRGKDTGQVHITRLNAVLLLNAVFMYGNIGIMVLYNNCVMNVYIHLGERCSPTHWR